MKILLSCSKLTFLLGLVLCIFGSSPVQASEHTTTITLARSIHFLAPDGSDVLVPPGTYTVEQAEEWLRLIPGERHQAFLLEAEPSSHEENIKEPLAVLVPGEKEQIPDMQMVMLLLPGGQSLTAIGSLSGIRARGLPERSAKLSPRIKPGLKLPELQTKESLQITPNIFNVAFFQLVGLWHKDPGLPQTVVAKPSNGNWYWPGPYDLFPRLVHLLWLSQGVPAGDINKIAAQEGYGLELRLNGILLQQSPNALSGDFYVGAGQNSGPPANCPQGKTCLGTSIIRTAWKKATPPWTVELTFWKKVKISEAGGKTPPEKFKSVAIIYPNRTTSLSYFTEKIYPIFKHDRCTTCHSLGSKEALVQRHNGLLSSGSIAETSTALGLNLSCGGGCHQAIADAVPGTTFQETEWKAPHFSLGIDWRNKTTHYICQKVTSHLPTEMALEHHFHQDARIAWAVHSRVLPLNKGTLPVVPPGNFHQFLKIIDPWIDGGFPCPKYPLGLSQIPTGIIRPDKP